MTAADETLETPIWSDREREAWKPLKKVRPSEWAETNRIIKRSSRPGPWRNANSPALVGVMDLCVRSTVREAWLKKAGQVGGSESIRNVLASIAHQEPSPALIVLPSEKDGKKIARVEILPLFEDTPVLSKLLTGRSRDKQLSQIILANGFDLSFGWSGSPSSLASHPYRLVILDETDKYETHNDDEAPPVELARVRTRTFGDRSTIIGLSTPTTVNGTIHKEWNACPDDAKFFYYVPCPHCGHFQRLLPDLLKWDKLPDQQLSQGELAELVEYRKLAWHECAGVECGKKITDAHKPAMLWAGYWGNESGKFKLFVDGREEGTFPETTKIGIHYPATIDLMTPFAKIAADWIRALGNPGKIKNLRNSTLAETYEAEISVTSSNVFSEKCKQAEAAGFLPMIVPPWVLRIIMGVDVQADHFYVCVRGFGHNFRSRRIHHGRVLTFDELTMLERTLWHYENECYPPVPIFLTGIDSGGTKDSIGNSRTDQVYQWCRQSPTRRYPMKGLSKGGEVPIYPKKIDYTPPGVGRSPYTVWLQLFNSHYFNDLLAAAIDARLPGVNPETGEFDANGGEELFQLNAVNDDQYNTQMSNMVRKSVKVGRGKYVERWEPKTIGARVDYRAVEYMIYAMAHGPAQVSMLPSPEVFAAMLAAQLQQAQQKPPSQRPGWMPEKPTGWMK